MIGSDLGGLQEANIRSQDIIFFAGLSLRFSIVRDDTLNTSKNLAGVTVF